MAPRGGTTGQPPAQAQKHGGCQAGATAQKTTARHGAVHHGLKLRVVTQIGGQVFTVQNGGLAIHHGLAFFP